MGAGSGVITIIFPNLRDIYYIDFIFDVVKEWYKCPLLKSAPYSLGNHEQPASFTEAHLGHMHIHISIDVAAATTCDEAEPRVRRRRHMR